MFQIRWHVAPRDSLASAWIDSDSATRRSINSAVKAIEEILRADPLDAHESRPLGRRIMFVAPLSIIFRVEDNEQVVSVLDLWLMKPRRQ